MIEAVYVEALVRVPGVHCWPAAPEHVAHLRDPHRHLFVIRARKLVRAADDGRQIEFITFGVEIEQRLRASFPPATGMPGAIDFGISACETIASWLLIHFDLSRCGVWEDDENGAIVVAQEPA